VATVIKEEDLVQSVSDALQYIACYHPPDFVRALAAAYESEKSPAARDAIAQILVNSRLCAEGGRPMCQDTGVVNVFLEIGMNVRWDAAHDPEAMVNEGVRRAWTDAHNPLRASIVDDPAGARRNTGDNAPAVIHTRIVAGDKLSVTVAAKGGGSENKAQFGISATGNDAACVG
jgi:fumarate hydratase class I